MHGAGRACQAHLAEYVEIGTRSALLNTGMPCQAAKWDAGETWHAIWGNGQVAGTASTMALPDELFLYILSFTDTRTLLATACASRRLRRLADDDLLWAEHSRRWATQLKHTCSRSFAGYLHSPHAVVSCKERFLSCICKIWPRCRARDSSAPGVAQHASWLASVLVRVPRLIGRPPPPPPMQVAVVGSGVDAHDYSLISTLLRSPGNDCPFRPDGFGELAPASGQSAGIRIAYCGRAIHLATIFLGNARERRSGGPMLFPEADHRLDRHRTLLLEMCSKSDAVLFMMDARTPLSETDIDDLQVLKQMHMTAPLAVALMLPAHADLQKAALDVRCVSGHLYDVTDRPWAVGLVNPHSYDDLSLLFSWMLPS